MTLSRKKFPFLVLVLLLTLFFPACATKMSLEEAKNVSISMAEVPVFTPPPRRIDDILSVLNRPGQFDSRVTEKFRVQADAQPPVTEDPKTLKEFYRDRGEAAYQLGHYMKAREDFQAALDMGIKDRSDGLTKGRLGLMEANCGNFRKAIDLSRESSNHPLYTSPSGNRFGIVTSSLQLVKFYTMISDLDAAANARQTAVNRCNFRSGDAENRFWCDMQLALMDSAILEAQGKYQEAGKQHQKVRSLGLGPGRVLQEIHPRFLIQNDIWHTLNLLNQQRLIEAEVEARKVLSVCLAHAGKESELTGQALLVLTRVLLTQGRVEEAESIVNAAILILESSGVPADSQFMGLARVTKGDMLALKEDYAGALLQFDLAKNSMKGNHFLYEKYFSLSPRMILSLLMAGRHEEAGAAASQNYENLRKRFGEKHVITAEMLALRGMAQARSNRLREALRDLAAATDVLWEHRTETGEFGFTRKTRRIIVEDYISLLAKISGSPLEVELGIDAAHTAFKLAETNRNIGVQGALVASSARNAVTEAQLADLIRKEQDAGRQILIMENTMLDLSAVPDGQKDPKAVLKLRDNIENLRNARNTILEEIKKRFPKYAEFVSPSPPSIASIQGSLHPGEALLSFYTTKDQTFIWAIPAKGDMKFAVAAIGRDGLIPVVAKLRKSLDPKPQTLGDIPGFDVSGAHDLYAKLFFPIESLLQRVTDLFIVANRPLDQIPLAILPTAPFQLAGERGELFSRYRQVPWLIRKFSLTIEPSVSAFVNLRALPPGDPGRKAFLGFGDPLFNRKQLAEVKPDPEESKRGHVQIRGIRITAKGALDNQRITSIHMENLNRLPDTAEEINNIARVLNADPIRDVFLREHASRQQVRIMNLADRKVIAFATHALVPGDLDGLDQPALALSSPSVTGKLNDGLMTMTDIMKLKLNADWIVLSACNTGAASGAGAEALSGLG